MDELGKSAQRKATKAKNSAPSANTKPLTKTAHRTRKKGRSFIKQQRKRLA